MTLGAAVPAALLSRLCRALLFLALALFAAPGHAAAPDDRALRVTPMFDDPLELGAQIERIQDGLRTLGIYEGPIDGIAGATTSRAIRLYESQAGLRVTGQPSKALLDHIDSAGRGARLLARIEAAKQRHIDQARQALSKNAVTRGLLAVRGRETADPTRDRHACFKAAAADCFAAEAFETAKGIADKRFRNWAFSDIAAVFAQLNDDETSLLALARVDDPRLIITALRNIAIAHANAGRIDSAGQTADLIPDASARLEAQAALALAMVRSGRTEDIGDLLDTIARDAADAEDVGRSINVLARLASDLHGRNASLAARKMLMLARQVAERPGIASDKRLRGSSDIAAAQAEIGDVDVAVATARELDDPVMRRPVLQAAAFTLADQGNLRRAIETAEQIADTRFRPVVFASVAQAAARAGDTTTAEDLLARARADADRIESRYGYARSFAFSRITLALATLEDFDGAVAKGKEIADAGLRAQVLWRVATAQAGADAGAARKTFDLAREAAQATGSDQDRVWALCTLAVVSRDLGDRGGADAAMKAALDIGAAMDSSFSRATAFARLAATLNDLAAPAAPDQGR